MRTEKTIKTNRLVTTEKIANIKELIAWVEKNKGENVQGKFTETATAVHLTLYSPETETIKKMATMDLETSPSFQAMVHNILEERYTKNDLRRVVKLKGLFNRHEWKRFALGLCRTVPSTITLKIPIFLESLEPDLFCLKVERVGKRNRHYRVTLHEALFQAMVNTSTACFTSFIYDKLVHTTGLTLERCEG